MTAKNTAVPFSTLSPSILSRERGLRVARQIAAVLDDHRQPRSLRGTRLLDIGCSSGIIAGFLSQFCDSVVGVDVDAAAIALARAEARRTNLEFAVTSGATLPFPSASFDVIVCNQVYYWVEDQERLMAEIFRVLAPGGTCFFATVNKYKPWDNQYRLPLVPMLPQRLADAIVRITGKGDRYGCTYRSFGQLRRLCRAFVVHRYTSRVLRDPVKYQFTNLVPFRVLTAAIPLRILDALEPGLPNFIWLLDKP